jgi:hypothetical protein
MKVNLTFGIEDIKNDFINASPFALPNDKLGRIMCHPENIDFIAEDGQIEELIAHFVINHIPYKKIKNALFNWIKKLSHNGTLEILYIDIFEICRLLSTNQIDEKEANMLIYGSQNEDWDINKNIISTHTLKNFFEENGMKIESVGRNNYITKIKIRRT